LPQFSPKSARRDHAQNGFVRVHFLAALMPACFFLSALARSFLAAVARWRPLRWLGSIAYGAYLFHQPDSGAAFAIVRGGEPRIDNLSSLLLTIVALALTLGLARLSGNFFRIALGQVQPFALNMNFCRAKKASYPLPFPRVPANDLPYSRRSPRQRIPPQRSAEEGLRHALQRALKSPLSFSEERQGSKNSGR